MWSAESGRLPLSFAGRKKGTLKNTEEHGKRPGPEPIPLFYQAIYRLLGDLAFLLNGPLTMAYAEKSLVFVDQGTGSTVGASHSLSTFIVPQEKW